MKVEKDSLGIIYFYLFLLRLLRNNTSNKSKENENSWEGILWIFSYLINKKSSKNMSYRVTNINYFLRKDILGSGK